MGTLGSPRKLKRPLGGTKARHLGQVRRRTGRILFLALASGLTWLALLMQVLEARAFTIRGNQVPEDQARALIALFKGHVVPGGQRDVFAVAFRPDGKILASGDTGGVIKLWDLATGKEMATLHGPTLAGGIFTLAFNRDGTRLASVSCTDRKTAAECKPLILWDVASGVGQPVDAALGQVHRLAFSPDGKILAIAHVQDLAKFLPGVVSLWDLGAKKVRESFVLRDARVLSIAFSPDGKVLAALDHTGWVHLVRIATCAATSRFHIRGDVAHELLFSPDGKSLLATGYSRALPFATQWDAATGKETAALEPQEAGDKTSCAAFLSKTKGVAMGTINGTIEMRDSATLKLLARVQAHEKNGGVYSLAVSVDGKLMASGGGDGLVKVWNVHALLKQGPQTNPKRK